MSQKSTRTLLLVAAASSLVLTACGTEGAQNAGGDSSSREESSVSDPPASPSTEAGGGAEDEQTKQNARDAVAERAKKGAGGDPVGPKNTDIPQPEDYGYGKAVATAQHGEVVAYTARVEGGRLIVPVTVHNQGTKRASYTVHVTVAGQDGAAGVTVTKKEPVVSPGTTWPTQADVTAAGGKDAEDLKVTLKVTKKNDPWASTS
ncbi:hypothetical protein AB0H77_25570 [Streptomyces sp. NPDC050844]|uniref:hypothetical protein n=1 Tax=Streptomyces sp. NPDC050844 TaxID=3155790 RepID=UPI0033D6C78E